jgi:hypothetical protein
MPTIKFWLIKHARTSKLDSMSRGHIGVRHNCMDFASGGLDVSHSGGWHAIVRKNATYTFKAYQWNHRVVALRS